MDTTNCINQDNRPIAPWSASYCKACYPKRDIPVIPRYWSVARGLAVLTEPEARAVWNLLQLHLRPKHPRPFPGDRPPKPTGPATKRNNSNAERIRATVPIEELAAKYTHLMPSGGNYRAKCPLHNETHGASFYIYTQARRWRCFGACATGGDVIELQRELMERDLV